MKKLFIIILFFINLCFVSSCDKIHKKPFIGDYTYNTSGKLKITLASGNTKTINLSEETGQMRIADTGEKDRVIVVRTSLKGEVSTSYATISDETITFDQESINKEYSNILFSGNADMTINAVGTLYDKMIVIQETYNGYYTGSIGDSTVNGGLINSDNVQTVAKNNQ